jgi:hypothetical protein
MQEALRRMSETSRPVISMMNGYAMRTDQTRISADALRAGRNSCGCRPLTPAQGDALRRENVRLMNGRVKDK